MEFSIISNRRIADCRDDNADIMRRLYFQGSQFFIQGIVGCLRRPPLDRIGILCCADFRDAPGGCDCSCLSIYNGVPSYSLAADPVVTAAGAGVTVSVPFSVRILVNAPVTSFPSAFRIL